MATSAKDIRVMVIGERGAGKSVIANKLFGFDDRNEERFPEWSDHAVVPSTGSQYLRKDKCAFSEKPNTTFRRVHVVEVPGFLGTNVSSPRKNWHDIINSFQFLKSEVTVFLLVLDVNHPKNGEVVTRAFVDFFGPEAGLNTMVLFTHNVKSDKTMANRFAMFHHGEYLKRLLGEDVPRQVLPEISRGEFPRLEILCQISVFESNLPAYNKCVFKEAQMKYMQNWAEETRSNGKQVIKIKKHERYEIIGVPDVLLVFGRYFSGQELSKIFP